MDFILNIFKNSMKQTFTSMKTTVLQEHIFHVFSGSNLCLFSSSISARKNFNLSASSMPEEMQTVRMDTDRMGSCADTSLTWASMEAVAQFWQLHLGTVINYLNKRGCIHSGNLVWIWTVLLKVVSPLTLLQHMVQRIDSVLGNWILLTWNEARSRAQSVHLTYTSH